MKNISVILVEKIKTHFMFNNFYSNIMSFFNVKNCGRDRQATSEYNSAQTTDTHTLRICNTYCYSTAIMVMRTCLHVAFVHAMSVLLNGKLGGVRSND